MNKELEAKLFKKYPWLGRAHAVGKTADGTTRHAPALIFGFEHADGWYKIVDNLLEDISWFMEKNEDAAVVRIKEKLGGLRVYLNKPDDKVKKLIDEAALEAATTCEKCGEQGRLRQLGWMLRTVCTGCYDEWERERKGVTT